MFDPPPDTYQHAYLTCLAAYGDYPDIPLAYGWCARWAGEAHGYAAAMVDNTLPWLLLLGLATCVSLAAIFMPSWRRRHWYEE